MKTVRINDEIHKKLVSIQRDSRLLSGMRGVTTTAEMVMEIGLSFLEADIEKQDGSSFARNEVISGFILAPAGTAPDLGTLAVTFKQEQKVKEVPEDIISERPETVDHEDDF